MSTEYSISATELYMLGIDGIAKDLAELYRDKGSNALFEVLENLIDRVSANAVSADELLTWAKHNAPEKHSRVVGILREIIHEEYTSHVIAKSAEVKKIDKAIIDAGYSRSESFDEEVYSKMPKDKPDSIYLLKKAEHAAWECSYYPDVFSSYGVSFTAPTAREAIEMCEGYVSQKLILEQKSL